MCIRMCVYRTEQSIITLISRQLILHIFIAHMAWNHNGYLVRKENVLIILVHAPNINGNVVL